MGGLIAVLLLGIADLLRMVLIAAAVLLSLTLVILLPTTHLLDAHKPDITRVAVVLCVAHHASTV